MGLKSLKLPRETVTTSGGEFSVRGLNLPDMTRLIRNHGGALGSLFDNIADGSARFALGDIATLAGSLMEAAPLAAVEAIALGASEDGEPDEEELRLARNLPLSAQLDALEKIGRLTFDTEGGPKKVLETVVRVARGLRGTMQSLQA